MICAVFQPSACRSVLARWHHFFSVCNAVITVVLTIGLLSLLLSRSCVGAPSASEDPQKAIQAAYDKAAEAARWKFIEGVFSIRTADFKAYDSKGRLINLGAEAQRLNQLFQRSLSVSERTAIVRFTLIDAGHASCNVNDVIEFEIPRDGASSAKLSLETTSDDVWVKTPQGWFQEMTRIARQIGRAGNVPGKVPEKVPEKR